MRRYETVVVLAAELGESKIKEEIQRLQGVIEGLGGREVQVDRWGTKEVGHRMRKPVIGQYVCFQYQSENTGAQDTLRENLRITDSVLKFQSHRINEKSRKFKGHVRKDSAVESGSDLDDVAGY